MTSPKIHQANIKSKLIKDEIDSQKHHGKIWGNLSNLSLFGITWGYVATMSSLPGMRPTETRHSPELRQERLERQEPRWHGCLAADYSKGQNAWLWMVLVRCKE